jgi:hypothetical protein
LLAKPLASTKLAQEHIAKTLSCVLVFGQAFSEKAPTYMTKECLDFASTKEFDFVCERSVFGNNVSSWIGEFERKKTGQ